MHSRLVCDEPVKENCQIFSPVVIISLTDILQYVERQSELLWILVHYSQNARRKLLYALFLSTKMGVFTIKGEASHCKLNRTECDVLDISHCQAIRTIRSPSDILNDRGQRIWVYESTGVIHRKGKQFRQKDDDGDRFLICYPFSVAGMS